MNESPHVFYRTLSPSGPLLCFLLLKFTIMQSRATGTADHILPLGDWFQIKFIFKTSFMASKNLVESAVRRGGGEEEEEEEERLLYYVPYIHNCFVLDHLAKHNNAATAEM